jgi:uncharacterized OsmC-like protein
MTGTVENRSTPFRRSIMSAVDEPLNGVNLVAVSGLAEQIQATPEKAATVWSAEVTWTGAFRSEAQIRGFAPLQSDEPLGLGGTDTAPNPVEQVLAALGNCLAVGYAANASAAGITIDELRISLDGHLDLRTFLGLADANAGYEAINVSVSIASDADDAQLADLHERVVGTSPVGHTLRRPVPVSIELARAAARV